MVHVDYGSLCFLPVNLDSNSILVFDHTTGYHNPLDKHYALLCTLDCDVNSFWNADRDTARVLLLVLVDLVERA